MRERRFDILEAAVREYIATGEPVSSLNLYHKYNFGIRPAMIRAELSQLEEDGYLEQPYHSAGRVPSNKGYEFFASHVLQVKPAQPSRSLYEMLLEGNYAEFLAHFSKELGTAGAVGTEKGLLMKEGLRPLMEHAAWDSRDEILEIIRDFDSLEDRISRLEKFQENFLDVFVGRKSPITRSDELAVMAGDYETDNGRIYIFAIGPKRMNYEKAAALLKGLKLTKKGKNGGER